MIVTCLYDIGLHEDHVMELRYLFDEIAIPVQTASTTGESYFVAKNYELLYGASIVLPPTYQLYVSVSIQQDLNVFAHGGTY